MQSATDMPDMCRPAVYRVRVEGVLSDTWTALYATLTITVNQAPDERATTTLVGPFRDQADLIGLLVRLFDLGYPVLFVEYLPAQAAPMPTLTSP